eukprot:TRINITY_DN3667_c0_g1_i10.p1 TRINITY_DN3667_c0_g1~~TRINITY_DN3667_c0_g1_i10.p1  ORF type:complete len:215 (-),score=48.11 TRINITY_DN3667_c0_g1_i10:20-664(-)
MTIIIFIFFFSSRRRHTRFLPVSWARRCVQETGTWESNAAELFFVKLGSWILLFTNFVPISLLVTLETVKFLQGKIIALDENCKSVESNIYTTVQTSSLNEELGQIQYIFSDKTGTLTKNFMEFKCISIGDEKYGVNQSADVSGLKEVTNVDFKDQDFFDHMKDSNHPNHQQIHEALLQIAICHTVLALSLIHISEPTRQAEISYAVFCLKKKK